MSCVGSSITSPGREPFLVSYATPSLIVRQFFSSFFSTFSSWPILSNVDVRAKRITRPWCTSWISLFLRSGTVFFSVCLFVDDNLRKSFYHASFLKKKSTLKIHRAGCVYVSWIYFCLTFVLNYAVACKWQTSRTWRKIGRGICSSEGVIFYRIVVTYVISCNTSRIFRFKCKCNNF